MADAGVPEIDVGPLLSDSAVGSRAVADVAAALDLACRESGFFTVVGHGIDPALLSRLDALARDFFALDEAEKGEIAMARAGRAWRGWFPVGGELTSGVPDAKEGLYFGAELGPDHPLVAAGTPMHGRNLFPRRPAELRPTVLAYMDAVETVADAVLGGIALGLGLDRSWFAEHLTADPLTLFRIFHYPRTVGGETAAWGVGEHTDYGLLTCLAQDGNGGLQVRTAGGWVDVAADPSRLVCNLGDMLERLTGGRYRSTPHRVRNASGAGRLSFPFFFDPSWDAVVDLLPIVDRPGDVDGDDDGDDGAGDRWDHTSVRGYAGTYGEYVLTRVGRVFPGLV